MASDALDLIGLSEIAELIGVSRQYADRLVKSDPAFPAPVSVIRAGRIWRRADVEKWARKAGRLK
jgi:predicted DNA-binding transcriptional regulator AlpA